MCRQTKCRRANCLAIIQDRARLARHTLLCSIHRKTITPTSLHSRKSRPRAPLSSRRPTVCSNRSLARRPFWRQYFNRRDRRLRASAAAGPHPRHQSRREARGESASETTSAARRRTGCDENGENSDHAANDTKFAHVERRRAGVRRSLKPRLLSVQHFDDSRHWKRVEMD